MGWRRLVICELILPAQISNSPQAQAGSRTRPAAFLRSPPQLPAGLRLPPNHRPRQRREAPFRSKRGFGFRAPLGNLLDWVKPPWAPSAPGWAVGRFWGIFTAPPA